MIGFYNYTVLLTYIGLFSSALGMFLTIDKHFLAAIFCLIISGTCDMFDGVVARSHKNRSENAKCFGIQIDSLCDLVCFGVFPAIFNYVFTITYCHGFRLEAAIISALFILCALIRLGYFNVMEMERQKKTTEARKYYQGLPVTSIAFFLPLLYSFRNVFSHNIFYIIINIFLCVVAMLFVLDIKVIKPHKKGIILMTIVGLLMITVLALQGAGILKF